MRKRLTRIFSFFSQWSAEVLRQPWLMVSLVLGPFLILLLFGEGEAIGAPRPRTVLVTPQGGMTDPALSVAPKELAKYLDIVATTSNVQAARADLVAGKADLVVALPADPAKTLAQGKHSQVQVLTNQIDPVQQSYADAYIAQELNVLNEQAIQQTIAQVQGQLGQVHSFVTQAQQFIQELQQVQQQIGSYRSEISTLSSQIDALDTSIGQADTALNNSPLGAVGVLQQPLGQLAQIKSELDGLKGTLSQVNSQLGSTSSGIAGVTPQQLQQLQTQLTQLDATATQFKSVPPDVLAAPFTLDLQNVAPFHPTAIGFYAPAVLVLLLQHLAVTLGALSMARVRLLGLMELFKTAPVKPSEVTIGNYLSYGLLCAVAGALLVALLVFALGVPIFGSLYAFVGMLLLLIFCSLGIGFFISMISASEQQAAQIAMLVLIASVFFSGFLVSLNTIVWPVRALSYILPATYAIRTLQDVMLRGVLHTPGDFAALAAIGMLLFALTLVLFRREFRPR